MPIRNLVYEFLDLDVTHPHDRIYYFLGRATDLEEGDKIDYPRKTHGTRFAITLASILKFGPRLRGHPTKLQRESIDSRLL